MDSRIFLVCLLNNILTFLFRFFSVLEWWMSCVYRIICDRVLFNSLPLRKALLSNQVEARIYIFSFFKKSSLSPKENRWECPSHDAHFFSLLLDVHSCDIRSPPSFSLWTPVWIERLPILWLRPRTICIRCKSCCWYTLIIHLISFSQISWHFLCFTNIIEYLPLTDSYVKTLKKVLRFNYR